MSEKYKNKIVLAPMVRIGTLPMRLLSLSYGADLVYTEELVDVKLLKCERKINDALGTVDYIDQSDGSVIFRTCDLEKDKVILQIGTCCPDRALQVAKYLEQDVSGIDVNMGCPKDFSLKGGMGAALLSNLDNAVAILKSLVSNLSIPVTCKIRVLESEEKTLAMCLKLQETGISAIAVHGRTVSERPQHTNRNHMIRKIAETLKIPVIANGGSREIESYKDINKFREDSGASSVMVARAAEWNASVFRKNGGMLSREEVIRDYLKFCVDYDNQTANSKYCIQNVLRELQESPQGKATLMAQTLQQLCEVWGLSEYYSKVEEKRLALAGKWVEVPGAGIKAKCKFVRGLYRDPLELPKTKLLRHCQITGLPPPTYKTTCIEKLFHSTVTLNGVKYSSSQMEKNKRFAEQGAAIVALSYLGILDKNDWKKYAVFY